MKEIKNLTKAEEEIMHMFWEHGPSTVSQLIEGMPEPKPPHSSISTIVRILEKKRFLDHKAYGRTYEYFPLIKKKEYSRFSLRKFVGKYFEGSMNELVSFLVDERDISLTDLADLVQELDNEKDQQP